MTRIFSLAILFLVASAGLAGAHPGHSAGGFFHGLAHPLTGFDHIAAMFAVGLLAARIGGKALWLVPGGLIINMPASAWLFSSICEPARTKMCS